MKNILLATLIIIPVIASAQEVNIKVTLPEAELIWKGLRKLPMEEVEVLMPKVKQQVMEQTTPKPIEPPKEPQK